VLLLHGFTGSSESWYEHIPALAQHVRVLAPDLIGHGLTDIPGDPARYRMEEASADLVTLLEQACALPAALLGYSMGGRLALHTALTYPETLSALIIESASPGLQDAASRADRAATDGALAARILEIAVPAFIDEWEALPLFASQQRLSPERRAAQRQIRLSQSPAGLANSLRGMGTGAQPSLWDRLGELTMPVLLIAGEHDAKFEAITEAMAGAIENAERCIIEDAGHTTHLEQPDQFQQAVLNFLLK
jgi:2-succinyl-6-hydroxy-2,4-cyclohexadiene-1-carboxylate synthase